MRNIVEIKLTGHQQLSAIVDKEDYRTFNLGSYKWRPMKGRSTIYVFTRTSKYGKTIYLHRLIMGLENAMKSIYVDHIDHNGLNNSRANLRTTDNQGNQRNSRKRISVKNTSNYKGVRLDSRNRTNPWRTYIKLSGKDKYIGSYRTEKEAATAYNNAAIEHFGDMANLNIITP